MKKVGKRNGVRELELLLTLIKERLSESVYFDFSVNDSELILKFTDRQVNLDNQMKVVSERGKSVIP